MTDMIERVAKAINDAMIKHGDYKPDELARAAIAAMREPTKAMKEAGFWEGSASLNNYRAMIDAALQETKQDQQ
jgi:hypothetical protein